MNTKLNTLLISLLSMTVALAGCTEEDPGVDSGTGDGGLVDLDKYNLGNLGAINGLLVDDAYRPIQLKQEWANEPGDYQDVGFMLLLETGQEIESNENGEFQVLDLEPGSYTLRTSAEAHEAIDKTIEVESGEFAEITVDARRKSSTNSQILTQEFAVFVDCWIPVWTELNCFADMSLDSKRAGFTSDMRALEGEVSYIFTEYQYEQRGKYDGDIGFCHGESFEGWGLSVRTEDGTYGSMWVTASEEIYDNLPENMSVEFAGGLRGLEFCTVIWPNGELGVMMYDPVFGIGWDKEAGYGTSTKARIMQSAFIGEPEVDMAGYCVICDTDA